MWSQGLLDRLLLLLLLLRVLPLLLLIKCFAQPWTLKGGVKPRQGKPSSIIKTRTRTELGPSFA